MITRWALIDSESYNKWQKGKKKINAIDFAKHRVNELGVDVANSYVDIVFRNKKQAERYAKVFALDCKAMPIKII